METSRQGHPEFLEKMEPRVPAGITKPIKMDKKAKDGCRRRPCGGGQYAAVAVATRENSDGTRRKGRGNPSRQHSDFSKRMHESNSSSGDFTNRHSKGKVMFQFIVLLAVAYATQAVPVMAEPSVKVGPLPNSTGTYVDLRNRIALMSAEWTITSYFDLRLLAQEITAFKKNIEELSTRWVLSDNNTGARIRIQRAV